MTTTDKDYAELLARLGIKPKAPTAAELLEELGEATW
jgi:hypothetical protein